MHPNPSSNLFPSLSSVRFSRHRWFAKNLKQVCIAEVELVHDFLTLLGSDSCLHTKPYAPVELVVSTNVKNILKGF